MEKELSFEQGPIRPPNEARSLLLRVTRNCPWNQCMFCPVYKGRKFSLRTVEEIKKDIQTAKDISDDIKALYNLIGINSSKHQDLILNAGVKSAPKVNAQLRIGLCKEYEIYDALLELKDNLKSNRI